MDGSRSAPTLPSTELILYEDKCIIKKRLTKSDLSGHSSRLMLPRRCVEDQLDLMGNEMAAKVKSTRGMKVVVRNADTRKEHKLVFRDWPSSRYVLTRGWNKFFEGQGFEVGDEIGMFWDQDDRKFHFTVHRKVPFGHQDYLVSPLFGQELLTGKSALNLIETITELFVLENLKGILDPTAGQWPFEQARALAHMALRCCDINPSNRPDLKSEVWPVLEQMQILGEGSSSNWSDPEESSQPPPYFICPISQEIMQDLHVAADGFTYEAEAIRGWFTSDHDTSPMTNLQLPNLVLVPNQTLQSAIQDWLQDH